MPYREGSTAEWTQLTQDTRETATEGQTLFVATDGDDRRGDGSIERPYKTIECAIEKAGNNGTNGGDRIFLREGTYYPAHSLQLKEQGSPWRWSRLSPWNNERVAIDGSRSADDNSLIFVSGSYYEISGLELVNARKSAISLYRGGQHVRVIGNVIHDSIGGAVYSDPREAACLVFVCNVVYHNCLSNQERNRASGWPSAVNLTHYRDTVVDNVIYENYGEALGIYGSGHYVAGNHLRDNFSVEIYLSNATDTTVEGNFIDCHGLKDYYRNWNLKEDPQAPPSFPLWAPSQGIAMANESPTGIQFARNRIVNNMIRGLHYRAMNWWNGKERRGGMVSTLIAHNTVASEAEALFHLDKNNHADTVIQDNLFHQLHSDRPLTDFHGVAGITFSHNLWYGGNGRQGPAGDGSGPGDVRSDPRLAGDLRLLPDSPAINAGLPLGVHLDCFGNQRPYDRGYDMGAHEWSKDSDN